MTFFRKHFALILLICVGLIGLASVLPYFINSGNSSAEMPVQVQTHEPEFSHEGDLFIYDKEGNTKATFEIEFAENEQETTLGLMYRKSMPQNRGMFFIFPQEEMRSFWMKNTYIALDIIYINAQNQVVSISKNATPLSETSRPSEAPAQFVLEVNAGVSDRLSIEVGDKISYQKRP